MKFKDSEKMDQENWEEVTSWIGRKPAKCGIVELSEQ